ncbi:hypothetical protein EV178_002864 [Coemansia sp. RSA 1646]|nr:hypothetical protein EV178_002864 [Coemansia sp. RSA 1646]
MADTVEQQPQTETPSSNKLTIIRFKDDATAEDRSKIEKAIIDNGGTVEKRMDLIGAIGVKLGDAHAANISSFHEQHNGIDFMEEDNTLHTQ